jgi:hypothetical protein
MDDHIFLVNCSVLVVPASLILCFKGFRVLRWLNYVGLRYWNRLLNCGVETVARLVRVSRQMEIHRIA